MVSTGACGATLSGFAKSVGGKGPFSAQMLEKGAAQKALSPSSKEPFSARREEIGSGILGSGPSVSLGSATNTKGGFYA